MFKRLSLLLGLTAAASAGLHAQTTATTSNGVPRAPAGTNDYAWLTPGTLPPPGPMIDAAIDALPRSISERNDWLKRMRKAVWIPSIGLRYDIGQTGFREYKYVDNRRTTTTSSESMRESSSSFDSSGSFSSGGGSQQTSDGLGAPVSADSSSSFESQFSQGSGGQSGSSYTTGYSQTDEGPTSIALGDRAHWVNQYGIMLSWDLSRLIFREEELAVTQAEINKAEFRQSIRDQVVQTYFDLKEALLLLDTENYKTSVPVRMRKERLAYLLDAMTQGALSTNGAKSGK